MKKEYLKIMEEWNGRTIDLCYELIEPLFDSDSVIEDFQLICESYEPKKRNDDEEYKHFNPEEIRKFKRTFGEFIDGSINTSIAYAYYNKSKLKEAYTRLWGLVFKSNLIVTRHEKAFALYWILIDSKLPYQNVFDGIKLDIEQFKENAANNISSIKRINYIVDFPFEQKTEVASLLFEEISKAKTEEEKAVLMVFALDKYAKENPPKPQEDSNE